MKKDLNRRGKLPRIRVRWVRRVIAIPKGRKLRVLIYARYSTSEQRRRSIKAQIEYCKAFLEQLNITNVEFTVFFDEKLSGELRSRPGIDQVWEGTKGRCWDLLLVEDCSRLYRDDIWCVELVRLAVDQAIRVICISDEVDTADEGWEPRLKEAAQHHALHNKYCSKRIKRAHEELWYALAALGLLRPGYRRRPSILATDEHPEEGPYFDEIDDRWAPIILETFERVAAREPMWSIAEWLTLQGLPKCNNCKSSRWTEKNVKDLIRRTIYRGFETYRDHISKKENVTGKHKPEANDDDEVLTREMPHLRIVSDVLWHMANKVIDDRALMSDSRKGASIPTTEFLATLTVLSRRWRSVSVAQRFTRPDASKEDTDVAVQRVETVGTGQQPFVSSPTSSSAIAS